MSGTNSSTDAAIPLQAGQGVPQPQNPLQTIGQFAETKALLNQNALFPGQQQLQQQQIQSNQTNLLNLNNQSVYRNLAPLLALPPGQITHDEMTSALGGLEAQGYSTHQVTSDLLSGGPQGDGPGYDAYARSLIASRAQSSPESAVAMVTPQSSFENVGNGLQGITKAPVASETPNAITPNGTFLKAGIAPQFVGTGGGMTPTSDGAPTGPAIPMTPTPDSLNQLERVWNAKTGQYDLVPRAQIAPMANGAGQQTSPLGTGRIPTPLLGPNSQPQAPAAAPGPAQDSQLHTQGAASAQAFQGIAQEGLAARGQNSILGTMLADTSSFSPGPTKINDLKATMQRYAPGIASAFGVDPNSVAANESFDKLSAQIANAQGAGSDARLAVVQHANPGSQLSPAGVDGIIRQLQGNADYLQARANLAASYPDQTDRAGFESKVGSNLDPRAFQFARMTPQQKATYAAALDKGAKPGQHTQDYTDVQKAYNWAVNNQLAGGAGG